jgi:Fe-S cluster biogenesis protein NfuA
MLRRRVRDAIGSRLPAGLRARLGRAPAPAPTPPPEAPPPEVFPRAALEAVLDEHVRPALAEDHGGIEVVAVRGGVVHVRLLGACDGCASATLTLRDGVERLLAEELPGFERLVQVEGP